ncbi:MAG: hypothetical protein PHN84_11875 [Desulfuromonadaceae bacterium]|nr:hypothetical protein [Desulfuromonadaceae bacterium]MDD2856582.1 hypothetical protein [Desulfuromonadaceae bacterium]
MKPLIISDIKESPAINYLPPFFVSGAMILTGCIILIIFWRRARLPDNQKSKEVGTPFVDSVERLRGEYALGTVSLDLLFSRLSDLLIARLVSPPLTSNSQTTDEILNSILAVDGMSAENFEQASALFKLCDQVKFARYRPEKPEICDALSAAVALIGQTSGAGQ